MVIDAHGATHLIDLGIEAGLVPVLIQGVGGRDLAYLMQVNLTEDAGIVLCQQPAMENTDQMNKCASTFHATLCLASSLLSIGKEMFKTSMFLVVRKY